MTHPIDAAQLLLFVQLLEKYPNETHLRAFPPNGGINRDLGARVGVMDRDLELIQQWNQEGRGLYVVINNGGNNDASIVCGKALFVEWDDKPIEWQINAWEELGLPRPTCQVLTGGKSVHSYWRTNTLSVARWRELQERLIHHAGCDPTIKNPSRVMRAPGCWYIDANGQHVAQSQLINVTDIATHGDDFDALLPALPAPPKPVEILSKGPKRDRVSTLSEIAAALDVIPARLPGGNTYELYRNVLWGLKAAVTDAGYSERVAIELMEAHSPSKVCGWNIEQIANSGGSQISAGTFWHHAKQFGWSCDAR